MVVDRPENRFDKLSPTEIAVAGATSGFITRALIQPFDVIKIRFQLQVEPISTKVVNSKYNSMLQAVALIYKEEGITAFWKGHVPAQILSVSFGLMQFWCFETLVKQAKQANLYNNKIVANFACGAVAGTAATVLSFPFDMMRTRLIAQSHELRVYEGLRSGYIHMIKNEGFFSLYKGLTPTVMSVAPNVGLQFMFYKLFDATYRHLISVESNSYNVIGSLVSGSLAGLCSKTAVYPLDLIRKRMQIQGFQKYRRKFGSSFSCLGMADCLHKIYTHEGAASAIVVFPLDVLKTLIVAQNPDSRVIRGTWSGFAYIFKHEGLLGLYRGLTPTLITVAPNAGSQFMFYTLFKRVYKTIVIVPQDSYNIVGNLVSGSMAGMFSKVILYPFDLTRRRMQIQGFHAHRQSFGATFHCRYMRHCMRKIFINEGINGFFKGIVPSILKAFIASAINFTTFDTVCRMAAGI